MPDFNKGDFTQQGVAGHVNANLRLNEKRLVNIDLTSNEEAEGCTITGTVKDLLNDKVYNIGSGGGGGSMSKTTLTIVNNTNHLITGLPIETRLDYSLLNNNVVNIPINTEGAIILDSSNMPEIELQSNQTMTLDLYYCAALGSAPSTGIKFASADTYAVSNVNNFTYNSDADAYLVTDLSIDSSITVTIA